MRAILVGLLLVAGCLAEDPNDSEPGGTSTGEQPSIGALFHEDELVQGPQPSVCDVLPCDGPCSLACDRDALIEQYVPAGFCISFFCELTDGRILVLDACHAPDEQ
jgi:hypothetical protein